MKEWDINMKGERSGTGRKEPDAIISEELSGKISVSFKTHFWSFWIVCWPQSDIKTRLGLQHAVCLQDPVSWRSHILVFYAHDRGWWVGWRASHCSGCCFQVGPSKHKLRRGYRLKRESSSSQHNFSLTLKTLPTTSQIWEKPWCFYALVFQKVTLGLCPHTFKKLKAEMNH